MRFLDLNHICVIINDLDKSKKFYEGFLGLTPHGGVEGWYRVEGEGPTLHLIEIEDAGVPSEEDMHHYYRHFAFEVPSLRAVTARSLELGFSPFQMNTEGDEHEITSPDDDLTFGIRTVFVRDPDNNLWEFVQKGYSWNMLWE
jgi:catechol 2,3-dioxygenase-like lactoylglutathione lyase family enzyme